MSKLIFTVPPIKSAKGVAQATQNRQYQYFKDPTYIYPVIPALFCSMLTADVGVHVVWADCVAEESSEEDFKKFVSQFGPDFMVFEANTMLFNRYCEVINQIKSQAPNIKIILCGEHATACYDEAKEKCKADYILKGGKWYYEAYKIVKGKEWNEQTAVQMPDGSIREPRNRILPHLDRNVSCWWLYAEENGNYKHVPATYMMAAQDCWYRPKHKDGSTASCTFCTWVDYHPENVIREVEDYLDEVRKLIIMGFKEFFDDSGTFPVGEWLHKFCTGMIKRGYHKHIAWGCNMRFKALQPEDFVLMSDAGCRFILWGLESANQKTLDKLNKGYDIHSVPKNLIAARKAGIWNHLTVMTGYPWETLDEEKNTFKMVKWLLLNDWASSMQSTIFMPYPGTTAFKEFEEKGILLTKNWDDWDMCHEVVKLQYPFEEALKLQREYYKISYHPRFVWNKIKMIRTMDDLRFYSRIIKKIVNRFGNLEEHGKS